MFRARSPFGAALAVVTALGAGAQAARGEDAPVALYRVPHGPLAALGDAPGSPWAEVSADGRAFVVLEPPALPPVEQLAATERRLAADLWVEPATRAARRPRSWHKLWLVALPGGGERPVSGLPPAPRLNDVVFAPDGRSLAFTHAGPDGVELWLADVSSARARRVPRLRLSAVFAPSCHWLPDGRALVCRALPDPPPPLPRAERGPRVEETQAAREAQVDAPEAPDLETRAFSALAQAQVVRVRLDGRVTRVGAPAVLRRAEPSPDGRYLLVEAHHEPYAFTLPATRFARRVEVWDTAGHVLTHLADLDLARALPAGGDAVRPGPREFFWRGDAPSTLAWSEAEAGEVVSDRVLLLDAPFEKGAARVVARGLRGRVSDVAWLSDAHAVAVTESQDEGRLRRYAFAPGRLAPAASRLLDDVALDDPDLDPGVLAAAPGAWRRLLSPDAGGTLYLLRGPAADGQPGLDRLDLATGRTAALWRSQPPQLERPLALLDEAGTRLLTRRETADEPPRFYLRGLSDGTLRALTPPLAPRPALPAVRHEVLSYARADGVALRADLTLPASWTASRGRLPVVVWIYPEAPSRAAGRSSGSPLASAPHSALDPRVWAYDGYAVLQPAVPVVAQPAADEAATFVSQVVAGVEAAVDEAVRRGVADRRRLALGGHSFGAGMAALVLARTDLFRCGVALAGSYNRTLTPFGFQGEARTLWRAPQVYLELSALLQADRIRAPLLLIHGAADRHPATPPEQSQRLYEALRGLGGRARLVLLPHEGHNLRGRESTLHALAEIQDWLARWLGAPTAPPS